MFRALRCSVFFEVPCASMFRALRCSVFFEVPYASCSSKFRALRCSVRFDVPCSSKFRALRCSVRSPFQRCVAAYASQKSFGRVVLLKAIGVLYSFLALPNPRDQSGYHHIKAAIKNLTPLSDCSERHLALVTAYSGVLTKEDNCYQYLILVLEEDRKKFKIQKKTS